ncbi:HIT family protein [Nonomuraea deserti]|uniref:HIT family protein n=1 Tax=Nonomuraea deserti TaxID=1848322 RepID=UPI001404D502|nr:HIT domain-containing protein [Nonomuraea deserti]
MAACVFCEIVAGRAPAYRVTADEHAVAFLDLAPAAPGHTLVVPRGHARDVWELPQDACAQVARLVHGVSALLRVALAPDGLSITHATGEAAGQDVFHFHTHVVPRWRGDDVRLMWKTRRASPQELQEVLERVTVAR